MFLYEGKFGNILHTGDCRLTIECLQQLPLKYVGTPGKEPKCQIDCIFLDCTFGRSPLKMSSRQSAIQQVLTLVLFKWIMVDLLIAFWLQCFNALVKCSKLVKSSRAISMI